MKVLHINTNDCLGGAARSAYRLFKGQEKIGIYARLLSLDKTVDDPHIFSYSGKYNKIRKLINMHCNRGIMALSGDKADTPWNTNIIPFAFPMNQEEWDVFNLHWINGGLMSFKTIRSIKKPIIWTLHDSWPFTGGCHIPYNCRKYETSCAKCPQLYGKHMVDLADIVFKKKQKYYPSNITIVCPSMWLADCAKNSSIFFNKNIHVIPNGLDMSIYRPLSKKIARDILGIAPNKRIILFGAVQATTDKNKGYDYLKKAIYFLKTSYSREDIQIIVFGGMVPGGSEDFPYNVKYMGHLHDDMSLVILYSAADVMIVPSKSESFGNTILEAMACGTPCVAFNVGGIPDLIIHKKNGYLAKAFEEEDLARGIEFVIDNEQINTKLAEFARSYVVKKYDIHVIAEQYKSLYKQVLENT